jgi:hypothetical protein
MGGAEGGDGQSIAGLAEEPAYKRLAHNEGLSSRSPIRANCA